MNICVKCLYLVFTEEQTSLTNSQIADGINHLPNNCMNFIDKHCI